MRSQTTARYACGPVGGATTPRRTPSSSPAGSTSARSTSTCDAWAYESRRRGRSSTSSPKGIPARGHVVFMFRIVAGVGQRHVLPLGPRGRGGDHHCRPAGWWPSPWPWTPAKSIGHRGRVRRGRLVTADPHGPVGRRITRWNRDSVRGTRGALVRDTQMTCAGFTGR